jgi:DNA-binding beta-propeller fold protein YncE
VGFGERAVGAVRGPFGAAGETAVDVKNAAVEAFPADSHDSSIRHDGEEVNPPTSEPARLHGHTRGSSVARLLVFTTITTIVTLSFAASVASAEQVRIFTGSFGSPTSTTPTLPEDALLDPWAVAVDQATGDVYVTDPGHNRVEKFSASGQFILMFGKEVNKTEHERVGLESGETLAQKEAKENVCTAASKDACQPGTAGSTPGAFEGKVALYVAVDNSAGPSKGDVYVAGLVEDPILGSKENLVQKFDSAGALITGWGDGKPAPDGQLRGASVEHPLAGPFDALYGIAVDPAGNLWVSTVGVVYEFNQEGLFTGKDWAASGTTSGVAVDAEDNVYLSPEKGTVKYNALGALVGPVTEPGITTEALTVNSASNDLYVGTGSEGDFRVLRYVSGCVMRPGGEGCEAEESFSSSRLFYSRGLAVDPAATGEPLYAAERNRGEVAGFSVVSVPDVVGLKASGFTPGSAVLNGIVNPAGAPVSECFFEYGPTTSYGSLAACEGPDAGELGSGSTAVEVHARVTGLAREGTYHFRLVAGNARDVNAGLGLDEPVRSGDASFGPPLIASESVARVTSSSAHLGALVNPDDVETRAWIEYGPTPGYGERSPEVDLGSGAAGEPVVVPVAGLTPGTVYYYRVHAESVLGDVLGEGRVFVTQRSVAGEPVLLDGREWELVSPADKHGAAIEPLVAEVDFAIQAAAGGGAVTYLTTAAPESEPAGNANLTQVLSTRGGPGGEWESRDIDVPHSEPAGVDSVFQEYRVFSEDLSRGLVDPLGAFDPGLSAEASEQTPYLRGDFPAGDPAAPCAAGCYRPVVSAADVSEGSVFGVHQTNGLPCPPEKECGPVFLGGSPDLGHVVIKSRVPLTEGAPKNGVYEWNDGGGGLQLVSVLPGGVSDAGAEPHLGQYENTASQSTVVRGAVSADGSRVVWDNEAGGGLFLRDVPAEATVTLGTGVYQDASSDGSRVFFNSLQKQTPDAGAGVDSPDLYVCEVVEGPGGLECKLTDLTPETGGEQADVLGSIVGASEDGSAVYFVADGVLGDAGAHGAVRGECEHEKEAGLETSQATCNLYVVRYDEASGAWLAPELVAVLSGDDRPDWAGGHGNKPLTFLTGRVSPDGDWVAFMSDRELTGYDNHDAASGEPDEEVYLYHAAAAAEGEGVLVCASCDPTGARPDGVEYRHLESGDGGLGLAGGESVWGAGQWLAANVPGWTTSFYQSRYLSDGGRLFFNSFDGLVARDTNATEDVYEYEPPVGAGAPAGDTCEVGSGAYVPGEAGCVGLISSGVSPEESAFLDASENGEEVFFLTTEKLAPQDLDTALDVYDAHSCSAVSPCQPAPAPPETPCVGDACQGSVEAPNDPTPGSLTFQGPGNLTPEKTVIKQKTPAQIRAEKLARALKACRKEKAGRKRAACEKLARKHYGPLKAKKPAKTAAARKAGRARRAG